MLLSIVGWTPNGEIAMKTIRDMSWDVQWKFKTLHQWPFILKILRANVWYAFDFQWEFFLKKRILMSFGQTLAIINAVEMVLSQSGGLFWVFFFSVGHK